MNRLSRITCLALFALGAVPVEAGELSEAQIAALVQERAGFERRALFLDAWVEADTSAQARARRTLRLERDGAERITATPSVRALTKAWRVLVDADADPLSTSPLRDLAESLDLRVVPGFYEGKPEGTPEALTVHVSSLYSVSTEFAVNVSLIWLGEDGKEIRARTEPVAPKAFLRGGFVMYIRAPSPVPGAWKLVCQLDSRDDSARGVPVPVIGLDQPEALLSGCETDTREQFDLLREHGVRPTFFRTFLQAMGVLPSDSSEDWSGARCNKIDHEVFRTLARNGHHVWSVGPDSVAAPSTMVLLLRPEDERPESALVGAVGQAWKETAREHGWWVLSSDLRLRSDKGASLFSLAAELKKWKPDCELVLVGRGAALLELQLAKLHEPDWIFDRIALSTVLSAKARPRNLPSRTGLLVTSSSKIRGEEILREGERESWMWKRFTDPLVVTDLRLPALIAGWLQSE